MPNCAKKIIEKSIFPGLFGNKLRFYHISGVEREHYSIFLTNNGFSIAYGLLLNILNFIMHLFYCIFGNVIFEIEF